MGINIFQNLNLSKKLTISFILLALIPVVIVTFIVENSMFDQRISEINEHNTYTAGLKANSLNDLLISQKNAMLTLAQSEDVQSMNTETQIAALKTLVKNSPAVSNSFICDTKGMQVARDSGTYVNVGDRSYIKAVIKEGKPFAFSDALLSKSTGKIMVICSVPIKDKSGQIVGAMASTFNMETLQKYLLAGTGNLADRQEIVYMTDTQGNVMVHPDSKYTENVTCWKNAAPVVSAMNGKTEAQEYVNSEGVDIMSASSPVTDLNWAIVVENHRSEVMDFIYKSILSVVAVVAILLVIAAICAKLLTSSFVTPLKELEEKTILMANGDLTVQLNANRGDEIGNVAQAFNDMTDQLRDVMEKIKVAASQVASGSKNISDSGNMLAQGASTQASSVEELSTSIAEITAQTTHNADDAKEANQLAIAAKDEASSGNDSMANMLKAMDEINESSANISKIIKTIEEIAFQTNILALNAAVEAARAGQYGKGFAVVAEEVRNLAARSAKAAKETTDIIETSFEKVEHGSQLANVTAEALKKIHTDVDTVASLINNIADASVKQSSALQMLNQGVLQVSNVVQTNSATAEESAAASVELSAQADLLQEAVSKFKI